MPELGKLARAEASGAFGLPVCDVFAHSLHTTKPSFGQLGTHGTPVRWVRDTTYDPVALEVVDQSGHGAADQILGLGQPTKRLLLARTHVQISHDLPPALCDA